MFLFILYICFYLLKHATFWNDLKRSETTYDEQEMTWNDLYKQQQMTWNKRHWAGNNLEQPGARKKQDEATYCEVVS